jgi:hypothetical protein
MAAEVMRHFPQEINALKPILRKSFAEFSQFLSTEDLPHPDTILKDPKKAKQIAEKLAKNPALRFSFESHLITCVIAHMDEGGKKKKFLESLSAYLENIPPDTVIAWFERLKERDKKVALLLTKALGKGFRPESRALMQHIFGEV